MSTTIFSDSSEKNTQCNIRGYLDERFLVLDKIQKGGFSKVRLCVDTETNQRYALKIFNEDFSKTASNMDLLSHEINTQVQFNNENIAKLYSHSFSGKLRKTPACSPRSIKSIKYVILELGERGALFELLQTKHKFPINIARTFFKQIVNGLNSLHINNVAHRDLKLENFIVDKDFNLKLIDFGFCCDINNEKKEHIIHTKVLGTESYMSPEMIFERKYFADKSDIFSLGVVLFSMLFGQFPFIRAARYDSSYASFAFKREAGIKKFWEAVTKNCDIPQEAIDLMNKMFAANANERITLDNIMKSDFFKGETVSAEELNRFF